MTTSSSKEMSKEAEEMLSCWQVAEGMYLPPLDQGMVPWKDHITNLRKMNLRSDDVLLCAYPKSGTHWLWEVTSMLLLGKAEYESRPKEQLMMEFVDVKKLDQMPSPRIFNTHLPFSMLPVPEFKAKGVKILHVYRNPKDTVVSFYHMTKQWPELGVREFTTFFEVFFSDKAMYGSYFDFLKQVNDFTRNNPEVPVMSLSYEDMKKSPIEKVKALAKFLGLDVPDSLCEEIEEACRFDNMKKRATEKKDAVFSDSHSKKKSGSEESGGGQANMYRKGQVGDWKNHLTVAMAERVDQLVKEQMEGLPFTLHFEQP